MPFLPLFPRPLYERRKVRATAWHPELGPPTGRGDKEAGFSLILVCAPLLSPPQARASSAPASTEVPASPASPPAGPAQAEPQPRLPHKHTRPRGLTSLVASLPLREDKHLPERLEKMASRPPSRRALQRSTTSRSASSTRSACSCTSFPGAQLIGLPRGRGRPPSACF